LLIGVLPFLLGDLNPGIPRWLPVVVTGSITLLGALSAAGSLALARRGEKRELLNAGSDMVEMPRTHAEEQELFEERR
jgi:hypothetical protein